MGSRLQLDCLTTREVDLLLRSRQVKWGLVLPVGCTEQHGPNVPLGCDTLIARGAAEALARGLTKDPVFRALVMPELAYSPTPGAESFAGTVSISYDCFGNMLRETLAAVLKAPWQFVIIVNAHGHNHGRVIEASVAGSRGEYGRRIPVVALNVYDYAHLARGLGLSPGSHAGEFEIALYAHFGGQVRHGPERPHRNRRLKRRPPRIFGLDIAPRSREGVISEEPPDPARALARARDLGLVLEDALRRDALSDLQCYFRDWNG